MAESNNVRNQPPTEEDWQRRLAHRKAAIDFVKTTPQYLEFDNIQRHRGLDDTEPLTPDPTDRNVSKRQWEKSVQNWRVALVSWCRTRS